MMSSTPLAGYPNDGEPSSEFPIYTRGNVGEALPNGISPMSGSLMLDASTRSQTRWFLDTGALSKGQVKDPRNAVFVQFCGYLYANMSIARIAAVRAPGMAIDELDAQYAGVGFGYNINEKFSVNVGLDYYWGGNSQSVSLYSIGGKLKF